MYHVWLVARALTDWTAQLRLRLSRATALKGLRVDVEEPLAEGSMLCRPADSS